MEKSVTEEMHSRAGGGQVRVKRGSGGGQEKSGKGQVRIRRGSRGARAH